MTDESLINLCSRIVKSQIDVGQKGVPLSQENMASGDPARTCSWKDHG